MNRFVKALLKPLQAFGRMALTNYLMQTVLMLGIAKVWNLSGEASYIQSAFAISIVLIFISNVWLSPMEKFWRISTYVKIINTEYF